jgi:hypothetical protein
VIYPKSKVTVSALTVTTEITEEDEGDPRIMEVSLHDDEAPGLIAIRDKNKDDSSIAFFVEQWPSIRSAVDQLAGCARTHDEAQSTQQWEAVMGKWEVIYDHGWHVVDVTDKSPGGQILICDCGIDPWSEMNAHKIAAAPELAEALRMVVAADTAEDWSRAVDYARAALAKAGVL